MSECRDITNDLSAFIDGELPADRLKAIAAHVERCSACAAHVAELRRVSAGIAAIPAAQPPPQFLADVRQKLRQPRTSWVDAWFRPVWWKLPLEAMAVVVIVAGVMAWLRPAPAPVTAMAKRDVPAVKARILDGEQPAVAAAPARELLKAAEPAMSTAMELPSVKAEADEMRPAPVETVVVRAESLVDVRLQTETLAKSLEGRLETEAPTNVLLVVLPQSQVPVFCSRLAGKDRAGRGLKPALAGARKGEPMVAVKVVVEPAAAKPSP